MSRGFENHPESLPLSIAALRTGNRDNLLSSMRIEFISLRRNLRNLTSVILVSCVADRSLPILCTWKQHECALAERYFQYFFGVELANGCSTRRRSPASSPSV
jgi:elongation factor P--beta-lysine ligase